MFGGERWIRDASQRLVRSRRVVVWAVLLAALALALAPVPLFGTVGFELAFAVAIVTSLAAADLGRALVGHARAADPSAPDRAIGPGTLIAGLWSRAAAAGLALALVPLAIAALNALLVRTCDWGFGLLAYALLPGLSVVVASGVGVLCGLLTTRRRLGAALPYLVILASVLGSVWLFYAAPPVFSYNPFAGYFPGNLYDEDISLSGAFFAARAMQLTGLGACLALAASFLDVPALRVSLARRRPEGARVRPVATLAVLGAAACALWAHAAELGFFLDEDDIAAELSRRRETEHFVIHYPGGGAIERDIDAIAADHEFRYAQVVRTLGAAPEGKITSFYFRDAEQKHRFIGARHVHMAKPWRREIYVNHAPFPHAILRHEIAHVVAGSFGDPLFHVSARSVLGVPVMFNVGLIEGIAVAADWPDHFTRELTPHQSVKAMAELGYAPPVDSVFSTGFLALSSARSYTLAGSVVRYLLEEHGAERLRVLYRTGGDFRTAYGRSQDDVLAAWRAMIDDIDLPEGAVEMVRERFRRPGIFARPCPHAIAKARSRARELAGRGQLDDAVRAQRSACRDAPREPRYRLELAELLAWADRPEEASAIYREIAGDGEHMTATLRGRALTRLAALRARGGDLGAAEDLLARAEALPLPDDPLRNVRARLHALRGAGAWAEPLRRYFWGGRPRFSDRVASAGRAAQVALAAPDDAIGHYLVGLNLRSRGVPDAAADSLSRALELGLPDPLLARRCARALAAAGFLAGDRAAVERAADALDAPGQPHVDRLYGRDWRERLRFSRRGSLAAR